MKQSRLSEVYEAAHKSTHPMHNKPLLAFMGTTTLKEMQEQFKGRKIYPMETTHKGKVYKSFIADIPELGLNQSMEPLERGAKGVPKKKRSFLPSFLCK